MGNREYKLHCLLANGEIRDCYPYDYHKKEYDLLKPSVRKYGDHYVYVEKLKGKYFDAELLRYVFAFFESYDELPSLVKEYQKSHWAKKEENWL